MPRLTVNLDDDQYALIEEKTGEGGEYESKSEAVRNFIRRGERVEDLERELERARRERRQILEQREEHTELALYVEEERTWRQQPLRTRLRWWLLGKEE